MTLYGDLLTPEEAMRILRVSDRTLRRYAENNIIACIRLPFGHRRFFRADIERILSSGIRKPNDCNLLQPLHALETDPQVLREVKIARVKISLLGYKKKLDYEEKDDKLIITLKDYIGARKGKGVSEIHRIVKKFGGRFVEIRSENRVKNQFEIPLNQDKEDSVKLYCSPKSPEDQTEKRISLKS